MHCPKSIYYLKQCNGKTRIELRDKFQSLEATGAADLELMDPLVELSGAYNHCHVLSNITQPAEVKELSDPLLYHALLYKTHHMLKSSNTYEAGSHATFTFRLLQSPGSPVLQAKAATLPELIAIHPRLSPYIKTL